MELLETYQALCEEAYHLTSQENALLKQTQLPSAEILAKKEQLLPELEKALEALKEVKSLSGKDKELAQQLQQKLMKIFILDRENEKLLLGLQMNKNLHWIQEKVPGSRLKGLYHNVD